MHFYNNCNHYNSINILDFILVQEQVLNYISEAESMGIYTITSRVKLLHRTGKQQKMPFSPTSMISMYRPLRVQQQPSEPTITMATPAPIKMYGASGI